MAGVHLQVISNIERGIAGIPAVRAKAFAKAFDVSVTELASVVAEDFYYHYLNRANFK